MKVLKIFLLGPRSVVQEIRRITVTTSTLSSYAQLCSKIADIFPSLFGKAFCMKWKDEEGDSIVLSSDEELAQAVANADDGIMKVYITLTDIDKDGAQLEGAIHPQVICDACSGAVKGYRYKCLECDDYDLCTLCNTLDKHPQHDMLKIVSPTKHPQFPWWRSMSGGRREHKKFGRGRKCHGFGAFKHGGMKDGEKSEPCMFPADYLAGVANVVARALDPFGIEVDVDVRPSQSGSSPTSEENCTDKSENKTEDTPVVDMDTTEPKQVNSVGSNQSATSDYQTSGELGAASGPPLNQGARPKSKSPPNTPSSERSNPESGTKTPKATSPIDNLADMINVGIAAFKELNDRYQLDPKKINEVIFQHTQPQNKDEADKEGNQKTSNPPKVGGLFGSFLDDWTVINPSAPEHEATTAAAATATSTTAATCASTTAATGASTTAATGASTTAATGISPTAMSGISTPPGVYSNQQVKYPDLSNIQSSIRSVTSDGPKSNDIQDDELNSVPLEPQIENALITMKSMGFTNEGGWLTRLLQAKKGNIAEALESLYPNVDRH